MQYGAEVPRLLMADEFSIMRLIPAGVSEIVTSNTVESKDGCGLIPIGQPATRI